MDQRSWITDHGSWILDLGPCFGMNDHPGRDTDVISRPSESTIKDLSFYIGFTRIGSRTLDLGPCFGMNGHFRRDPDVISRPPESTIDFLSVFIGVRNQSRLKIIILDEMQVLYDLYRKTVFFFICYFVPGIILGYFSYRTSFFRLRKIEML